MRPTITAPNDFETECEQTVAGVTFYFARGFKGEGLWFHAERVGNSPANSSVPLMLQSDLSTLTRNRGVEERHNFSRFPPKPTPPPKAPRGSRKKKATVTPLMGGFNPFGA